MRIPDQARGVQRRPAETRVVPAVYAQLARLPGFVVSRPVFVLDEDPCFVRARDRYLDCQIDCQATYEDGTLRQEMCLDNCDVEFDIDTRICRL